MSVESSQSQALSKLPALFPKGLSWWLMLDVSIATMMLGGYAYWSQCQAGLVDSGMRSVGAGGATWGLSVAFYIYFVGISFSDIVIALLIRLFHIEALKPLGRLSELLTLVALMVGGLAILTDQGRLVYSLINIAAYGRLASPFFGTFSSITGGYFFASVVFFYLASRPDAALLAKYRPRWAWAYKLVAMGFKGRKTEFMRHYRVSFWMALIIMVLLVVEQSTLGFVFGIQSGRPGWYSALKAPGFLVLAGASGIGMLMLVGAFLRRYLNLYKEIHDRAFYWLSNFMWIMVLVYLYFVAVEELTANYAAPTSASAVSQAIVTGPYAGVFWVSMACFVIPLVMLFVQFLRRKVWMVGCIISSILVNVAVMLERFLLVVPSQTNGMMLPYPTGTYSPGWGEYAMIAGLFALGMFSILVFIRLFPIVPVLDEVEFEARSLPEERGDRNFLRLTLFALTLGAGLTLSVVGLLASLRYGTGAAMDPVIPFAPAVFITGMGITLFSAIVYELSPGAKPAPAPLPVTVPPVQNDPTKWTAQPNLPALSAHADAPTITGQADGPTRLVPEAVKPVSVTAAPHLVVAMGGQALGISAGGPAAAAVSTVPATPTGVVTPVPGTLGTISTVMPATGSLPPVSSTSSSLEGA